jgi:hypothetical protein
MSFETLYLAMVVLAFAALAVTLAFGQIYTAKGGKDQSKPD